MARTMVMVLTLTIFPGTQFPNLSGPDDSDARPFQARYFRVIMKSTIFSVPRRNR